MAGRPTDSEADLVPAEAPAGASYDRDFYNWSLEQARLAREGRWDAVDRDNVAEEIESLGREQFNRLACPYSFDEIVSRGFALSPRIRNPSPSMSIPTPARRSRRCIACA